MIGIYRVALSLLVLFSAIAAHAEDPFAAVFGNGFGAGVQSGYQSQSPYGAGPGGFGGGGFGAGGAGGPGAYGAGTPGFVDPSGSAEGGTDGERMVLAGCNVKCDEERAMVAAQAYQQRNQQTTASIMATGAQAAAAGGAAGGATASISGTDASATTADTSSGQGAFIRGSLPDTSGATASIYSGAAGATQYGGTAGATGTGGSPPVYADKGQCVQACMAPFQAKYGGDPKNKMDPQALIFLLQQGSGGNENQEPTPPGEYGDNSDGSTGGAGDDFFSQLTSKGAMEPQPTPQPSNDDDDDD